MYQLNGIAVHDNFAALFQLFQQSGDDFAGGVEVRGDLLVADFEGVHSEVASHAFEVEFEALVEVAEGYLIEGDEDVFDAVAQAVDDVPCP